MTLFQQGIPPLRGNLFNLVLSKATLHFRDSNNCVAGKILSKCATRQTFSFDSSSMQALALEKIEQKKSACSVEQGLGGALWHR